MQDVITKFYDKYSPSDVVKKSHQGKLRIVK